MITKLTALKNHAGFIRYFTNTSWMMGEQFKQMAHRFAFWVVTHPHLRLVLND